MTIDQLRAFDAIVRLGTFAAAARELGRVPSALTYAVKQLESDLGVSLFERGGRRVSLTPAGRRLLENARRVLAETRELERAARDLAGGWEAQLHVVVDGALPPYILSRCVARFSQPDVPTLLRVDVEYQEGVLERIERDDADLALYLGFDRDTEAAQWECVPLPPLPFVLVAASSHPLAAGPAGADERAHFAEVVVRDSSSVFADAPKPSYLGSHNVVVLSDFHAKRVALLDGAGFGWMPAHLVRDDLEAGTLAVLDAELARWTYAPVRIARRGRSGARGARLFLDTLQAALADVQEF